jgi:tripartite ATP-independent transporter DctP family solute receptor
MKKYFLLILILTLSIVLLIAGCGQKEEVTTVQPEEETIVLKMGHKSSESHSWHKGCLLFKEIVEEKTNNKIKVEIYPNSQLGNQKDMTEASQLGVVDIVLDLPAILANFVPEIGVYDLPFVFKDYAHAYETLDTIGMETDEPLQDVGLKLLAMWETGFKRLSGNTREIKTIEDLKGLKIRVPGSPVLTATIKAIGANPISVAWNETYIALQQGTADGQFNPPSIMVENKIHEVQKFYANNLNIQYGAEPVVMSLKTWNKLSPEFQKIVQEAAIEARDYQREICQQDDLNELQTMVDAGIKVYDVSDEVLVELMEMTAPVREEYADKELLDRINKLAN